MRIYRTEAQEHTESELQQQQQGSNSNNDNSYDLQQAQNRLTDTLEEAAGEERNEEEASLLGAVSTSSLEKQRRFCLPALYPFPAGFEKWKYGNRSQQFTYGFCHGAVTMLNIYIYAALAHLIIAWLSSPPATWDPALDQCERFGSQTWFTIPPFIQLYGNNHNISIEVEGHVNGGVIQIMRSSPDDVYEGGGAIMSRVNIYPGDLGYKEFDYKHDFHPDKGTHLLLSLPDRDYYKYRGCIYITMNVYVPAIYARTIAITTHDMEIIVNDDISTESNPMDILELRTENAPIRFNSSSSSKSMPSWYGKQILLSTTNAEIHLNHGGNLRATELVHLETSHYPIQLYDVSVSNSIQLKSFNAPIDARNISAKYIKATAATGSHHNGTRITMQNVTAQEIHVQTHSEDQEQEQEGPITLKKIVAQDTITADANTGHVYAELLAGSEHVNASFASVKSSTEVVMPAEFIGAFKAKSWTSRATVKTLDSLKDEEGDDDLIFEVNKYDEKVGYKKNKDPDAATVSVISIYSEANLAFAADN